MDATLGKPQRRTVHVRSLPVMAQERIAEVRAAVLEKALKLQLPGDQAQMLADCARQAAADVYEAGHL